ncbi:DUF11 domain-containing protein [Solihabitans fulvus]|uniref:DUF11 domain-containing protein n=1 Tax=Solihabitans fulvus TaxID=1892852 RepID=A0A5B2WPH2_9PSEU|nr:DUF11 domain-containing protein [Solihabitans fulvus]KAA2252720.1 DUF11 domain-containing protein [Solihabitans fulvus]
MDILTVIGLGAFVVLSRMDSPERKNKRTCRQRPATGRGSLAVQRVAAAVLLAALAAVPLAAPASAQSTPGELTIAKSASTGQVQPGGQVVYTVEVRNTGGSALRGVTATDDLTGVLDDATYNNDATSGDGAQLAVGPTALAWTFDLAAGAAARFTYSVTARASGGDGTLASTVSAQAPGVGASTPCVTSVVVVVPPKPAPDITVVKNVDRRVAVSDNKVIYTIDVVNRGTAAGEVNLTDDLTDVVDDATYNNDAAASTGPAPAYTAAALTWQSRLDAGQKATITYSVTLPRRVPAGNKVLRNAVTAPGTNCADGTAPECRTEVLTAYLTILVTDPPQSVKPGATYTYAVAAINGGSFDQVGDYPVTIADDLSGVVANADYNNDASGPGTINWTSPTLTFRIDLRAGEKANWTFTATDKAGGEGKRGTVARSMTTFPTAPPPARTPPPPVGQTSTTVATAAVTEARCALPLLSTPAQPDQPETPLAATGPAASAWLATTGAFLLATGAALTAMTRRRPHSPTPGHKPQPHR